MQALDNSTSLPGDGRTVDTLTNYLANNAVFNVLDYFPPGYTNWQGTDDHSNYIEAAVDDACVEGGVVYFPPTIDTTAIRYNISRTITIASKYPVALKSFMAMCTNPDGGFQSYIAPLNDITGSIFEYATPTANRSDAGGGLVDGLVFFDPGIRSATIGSALELTDFCRGTLQHCYFYGLKGAAYNTDYAVMSSAHNVHVLYCGDTDVPAVTLGKVGAGTFVTQSFTWIDGRLEVCYGAPYLSLPAGTGPQINNKLVGLGFEADTTIVATNQTYIALGASSCQVQTCHFNRNSALALDIDGSENVLDNLTFNASGQKLDVSGDLNRFGNIYIKGDTTNTGDDVAVSGTLNAFTGLTMRFAGRLNLGGTYNTAVSAVIMNSSTNNDYTVEIGTGCTFTGVIRNSASAGGIRLTGTSPCLGVGSLITGNPGIGIRNESSNAIVSGVHSYNNTTSDFSANTLGAIVNNNFFLTSQQQQEELRVGLLGKKVGADFNTTADQAIAMCSASYVVTAVIVTNPSTALTAAQGGVYPATGKGGTPVVAATQTYTDASVAASVQTCTLNAPKVRNTQSTLYLSLTTAQGAAATADVYVFGYKLD